MPVRQLSESVVNRIAALYGILPVEDPAAAAAAKARPAAAAAPPAAPATISQGGRTVAAN